MKHCPKCLTEYRDGFDKCADCNVELIVGFSPKAIVNKNESYQQRLKIFSLVGYLLGGLYVFVGLVFCCWYAPAYSYMGELFKFMDGFSYIIIGLFYALTWFFIGQEKKYAKTLYEIVFITGLFQVPILTVTHFFVLSGKSLKFYLYDLQMMVLYIPFVIHYLCSSFIGREK